MQENACTAAVNFIYSTRANAGIFMHIIE